MSYPNEAFFTAMQAGVCPLAKGTPGIAKTEVLNAFAEAAGRKIYTFIGSIREPSDMGIPFPNCDAFDVLPPRWASDIVKGHEEGHRWLLFLDEFTCSSPAMQAGMLRVVAERVVGDKQLPDDLWIAGACNPPQCAANGFDIEPPMANRMCHLPWESPWKSFGVGMARGGRFPKPEFRLVPEGWEAGMAKVGGLIAAYREKMPSAFEVPTDANGDITLKREALSGAWPSMRSWFNLMKCEAAAKAAGCDEDVVQQLRAGNVSEDVAHEFGNWERELDLPDPEYAISAAAKLRHNDRNCDITMDDIVKGKVSSSAMRSDRAIAFLNSVVHQYRGVESDKKRYSYERFLGGVGVVEAVARVHKDVALMFGAKPMCESNNASGGVSFSEHAAKAQTERGYSEWFVTNLFGMSTAINQKS